MRSASRSRRRRCRPRARRPSPRPRSRGCARRGCAARRAAGRRRRTRSPSSPSPRGTIVGARALEDAELRVAVRLERAVAVEVVGLEVEQDGDVARERVHVLELEARELADDGGAGLDLQRDVRERRARRCRRPRRRRPAARKIAREQLGRRRLAVRARDPDQRVAGQQPVAELDLAPDAGSRGPRRRGERRVRRDTRAFHDELDTVQQGLLLRSETNFDALRRRAFPGRRRPTGRPRRPPPRAGRARAPPPAPSAPSPSTSARRGSQSGVSSGRVPLIGERSPHGGREGPCSRR